MLGQTNNLISIDRDSLYKVFVNYEGAKLTIVALSADKINLTELVRVRESQIADYRKAVLMYDSITIPAYQEKDKLRLEQIKETEKAGKKKAKKNFINGAVVGGVISLLIFIL